MGPKPSIFEVLNIKNVPLIRHGNVLINMSKILNVELVSNSIRFFTDVTKNAEISIEFLTEEDAQLAFEKIMGGNKAVPTSKQLKDNKTKHTAAEQEQAEWL